jgi:hypothetical protein
MEQALRDVMNPFGVKPMKRHTIIFRINLMLAVAYKQQTSVNLINKLQVRRGDKYEVGITSSVRKGVEYANITFLDGGVVMGIPFKFIQFDNGDILQQVDHFEG